MAVHTHSLATRAQPQIVVLGGGFAGLALARGLRNAPVRLTLIDRTNHHLFQPLLYQVATAALEPADIARPIRQLVRSANSEVLLGEALGIDPVQRCVKLKDRDVAYDYLVIATGSAHSYFGHDDWARRAPGLKTLEDAMEIRRRVLFAFEAAERCTDPELQREWLTFVVVGAGPTGVELAGALADIARQTRAREFRHIDASSARVILLEGLPRVLTAYPESLSLNAKASLERLGVTVQLNTKVTAILDGVVETETQRIAARTVLWAAGVAASPLARSLGTDLDRVGRVPVTPELSVPGHPEIYVIGDLAALSLDAKPLPGLAPVAMAQGKHAAKNIRRAIAGEPLEPFQYWDRGSFAVVGRGAAVGIALGQRVAGYFAWLAWLAIHIAFLVGFRNRIAVLFNWAYVYFTGRRHAKLIVGQVPQPQPAPTHDSQAQHQPVPLGQPARSAGPHPLSG